MTFKVFKGCFECVFKVWKKQNGMNCISNYNGALDGQKSTSSFVFDVGGTRIRWYLVIIISRYVIQVYGLDEIHNHSKVFQGSKMVERCCWKVLS